MAVWVRVFFLHGICAVWAISSLLSVHAAKWSISESEADFEPTVSVLEQWSELSSIHVDPIDRQDTFRTASPDREDKVMKKQPDRIINRPPNKSQDVSETDLFLLGAIEKLAYRMDFLEKRTRRLEDMLYQLLAGTQNQDSEPCPDGFFRQSGICYHVSSKQVNWKSASSMCRSLGGILLELQTEEQRIKFISNLHTDLQNQGSDFWTGGLNPGLLWLWGTSAKPISTNTTQTDITGSGRCLLLGYQPPTRSYKYKGADCGERHRYICQIEDNTTERRLQRLLRDDLQPLPDKS